MAMKSFLPSLWSHGDNEASPFRSLHHEMDRLFSDFERGFHFPRMVGGTNGEGLLSPRVNIRETEKAIEITAELPGVDDKDIDVSLANNRLTIKGEKKLEKKDEKEGYVLVERSYGSFQRTLPIPYDADPEKVDAKFENGVLHITLPKPPEVTAKTQKIQIKSGK